MTPDDIDTPLAELREILHEAVEQIGQVLSGVANWEGGADWANEDQIVGELDSAERSLLDAQRLVVSLINPKRLGEIEAVGTPPNRLIFERWRHRLGLGD